MEREGYHAKATLQNRKSYVSLLTRTVDILLSVIHLLAVCVAVTVIVRVGGP